MTFTIDDRELDSEIARLAAATGETPDELVKRTLRQNLVMQHSKRTPMAAAEVELMMEEIRKIQADVAKLPVLDDRTADEIIGYNEHGHFD
jgi:antitoxin VapB